MVFYGETMKALKSVALLAALSGCFVYVPAEPAGTEMGSEVRAYLSQPLDIPLGAVTVRDVNQIDGFVARSTVDSLSVQGTWLRSLLGHRYYSNGAMYYFQREELASVEVRKLHAGRTVVFLAAGAGIGFGLITFVVDLGTPAGEVGGPGDIAPNVMIPIP